jgi:hypothetical protein
MSPFFLENISNPFGIQVMFVTPVSVAPYLSIGGDPWHRSLDVRRHQTNRCPSALPMAMSVPSGLMARAVGSPWVGVRRVDAILYLR